MGKYLAGVVGGVVNTSDTESQIRELHPILLGDNFFATHAAVGVRIDQSGNHSFTTDVDNFRVTGNVDFTANPHCGNAIFLDEDNPI